MTVEELLEQYAAGVRDFKGIELSEANLSGAKLRGVNFSHANLSVVNFSGANLSVADLSHAKLNVARLSGANLVGANLSHASLNVANLIRADLSHAQLRFASLIRSELIRADLSSADLSEANLCGADLREATLRHAILRNANLSDATLRDGLLTGANLEQAKLNSTDLSRTDLGSANFRDADLKQANLNRANLSGANLIGANLRWADLSGANLTWADLSGAKLSGAILLGADLSHANLTQASLLHADLTQARLFKVEWAGADLTKAILTGAKVYATSRFGLKTDGMICEWVDLSPTGDHSIIQYFNSVDARDFFNETPPTIQIIVDRPLDYEANFILASAYYQIAQQHRELKQPPSLQIGPRRTVFTFQVDSDESLFPIAYVAVLPFKDAATTQKSICTIVEMIMSADIAKLGLKAPERVKQITTLLEQAIENVGAINKMKQKLEIATKFNFFQAPTQTILTNSSGKNLVLYNHPNFGKKILNHSDVNSSVSGHTSNEATKLLIPSMSMVVDFFLGFHYMNK
ncbi:MAG: pentapeptide repeat-containing protein [Stigonema ocellatum SAG 48.90 = DSM 106950]|nr:pentapeptide repeat-containing protein [Stigonema ocellatum SAG 48.90 = DSM 106950]